MSADHPISAVGTFQYLLTHDIHIMLYSGEFDLNCNTLGTLHTLEDNKWRGKSWTSANRSLWKVQNDVAGNT